MEAPRHLEIATFKWYDDIRNPAELFFSNLAKFTEPSCRFKWNAECEEVYSLNGVWRVQVILF